MCVEGLLKGDLSPVDSTSGIMALCSMESSCGTWNLSDDVNGSVSSL